MANKAKVVKKVNEVVQPYCHNSWCILKELIISKQIEPRLLVQLKCIEHFKYEESEKAGKDLGEESYRKWVDEGYAKLFAEYYDEDLTAEQIYEKIIKHQKN